MSVQVSYKKQFVIFLLLTILLFSVVEGIARIIETSDLPCGFIDSPVFSDMDYSTKRSICLDATNIIYDETDVRKISPNQHFSTININSHGFRGVENTIEKSDDTYRIILLGGSTAFGIGSSSDDTTISGYLQKKLTSNNLHNIEILNAGVGGTISFEEKYFAENYLMEFQPDLFIVYDGGNDVRYRITEPETRINEKNNYSFKFGDYPFYRTPFVIDKIVTKFSNANDPIKNILISEDVKNKIVDTYIENWKNFCNSNEIDTVVFLQPMVGTGFKQLTESELEFMMHDDVSMELAMLEDISKNFDKLKNSCTDAKDIRDVFDHIESTIYYDQIHVSDAGNKIIAEEIFEQIYSIIKKNN